jgi:ABC-type transport system involved in multi-copper enzyme maturation permease subunit
MRKRISRIAPVQLGKVCAVLYAIFSIPVATIMAIAALFAPENSGMSFGFIIAMPVFYIVFGFIFMAIGALLYNLVAKWVGGVEYMTDEISDA